MRGDEILLSRGEILQILLACDLIIVLVLATGLRLLKMLKVQSNKKTELWKQS